MLREDCSVLPSELCSSMFRKLIVCCLLCPQLGCAVRGQVLQRAYLTNALSARPSLRL